MSAPRPNMANPAPPPPDFSLDRAREAIGEWDQAVFQSLVTTELTPEEKAVILNPTGVFPGQKSVLAIHWHPEWIPLDLTLQRIALMFPNREEELIIPTQHNELLVLDGHAGVEVDCYSSGFNRKIQLLAHFRADRLEKADAFKSMLAHTFKYRQSQLFEFLETLVNPDFSARLDQAAAETGAGQEVVDLVRFYAARLGRLIEINGASVSPAMIKNKLLSEFLAAQRVNHPPAVINRGQLFLKAVKQVVKNNFSLSYFYRASEVIEEVRGLGGGVVVPHPEQFWPVLLAEYDVDGYEVWNPQSREYTEFLIRVLNNQNKKCDTGRRRLLIFMGDDTHLSAKIRNSGPADRDKIIREVGWQPAWDELAIAKTLGLANAGRSNLIKAYRERLG